MADREQLLDLRCGNQQVDVTEVQGFATVGSSRRLYAATIGSAGSGLKADVSRPDGSSLLESVQSVVPLAGADCTR